MPIFERVSLDVPVTIKTDDYTFATDDNGTEVQFQKTTAVTANLPSVNDLSNGFNVVIRNIGSGTLTIDPSGGEQIDGGATLTLDAGEVSWIRNDGTEWKSLSGVGSGGGGGGAGSITLGTAQAASGASVSFTGIPSGTKRIVVMFAEVSLNGSTDNVLVRIGDSGGLETTGYTSTSTLLDPSPIIIAATANTGFVIANQDGGNGNSGQMILSLMNSEQDGDTWVQSHTLKLTTGRTILGGGDKKLSGELTQLQILSTGSNTFDNGTINIQYES